MTQAGLVIISQIFTLFVYHCDFDLNSLAPGRFQFNFRWVIFKLTLVNGGCGISYEITLRWMPRDLTDNKSTLVQVMAWWRQATSHYLSQCWPRSMSPNGVTRPQWVNLELVVLSNLNHMILCLALHEIWYCSWPGAVVMKDVCALLHRTFKYIIRCSSNNLKHWFGFLPKGGNIVQWSENLYGMRYPTMAKGHVICILSSLGSF